MRDAFPVARVLGIPIRIHWSWFAVLGLITWTLAEGYFPARLPALSSGLTWLLGLVAALLLFGSVLLHELSHALVARLAGLPVSGITLHVFGGVAQLEREPDSPRTEFVMAAVGPLASYLVAVACWLALRVPGLSPESEAVLLYLGSVNALVGTFNLVPGFPLDGGRLLRSTLWAWRGDLAWATRIAGFAGSTVALVLVAAGGLRILDGELVGGLWLMLIGLFLHQAASGSYEELVARRSLERVSVAEAMSRDVVAVPASATVERLVDVYFWQHHVPSLPVVADAARPGEVVGIVTLDQVKALPRGHWPHTVVRDVMVPLHPDLTVAPAASCWEALGRLARSGVGCLVVLEGGRLVGCLRVQDVVHLLTLQAAAGPDGRIGRGWSPAVSAGARDADRAA
jgi:Zn-dependent protease